jgi:hypothetical protein
MAMDAMGEAQYDGPTFMTLHWAHDSTQSAVCTDKEPTKLQQMADTINECILSVQSMDAVIVQMLRDVPADDPVAVAIKGGLLRFRELTAPFQLAWQRVRDAMLRHKASLEQH